MQTFSTPVSYTHLLLVLFRIYRCPVIVENLADTAGSSLTAAESGRSDEVFVMTVEIDDDFESVIFSACDGHVTVGLNDRCV